MNALDEKIVRATQAGLPLVAEPYAEIAKEVGVSQEELLSRLKAMLADGRIRRIGAVPNHYALGYTANAMSVWDVADAEVDRLGQRFGFAAAPVQHAKDHHGDRHLRARGSVWHYEDPMYGPMVEYGPAPKLSETPGRIKWGAKPVGFHNEYVFRTLLGLTSKELRDLADKKVIGKWADRVGAKPPDDWMPGECEIF